jgi:non-ribosomal peptide synthetase component F
VTSSPDRLRVSEHAGSHQISFNQEQICLLEAFYPQNRAYNFQATVHIDGALDLGCLEAAVSHVVARHEMLRTTITLGDDGYHAIVHPPGACRIPCHDLSALGGAEQAVALDALFARCVRQTFDVEQLPLFHLEAARLAPDTWRLIQVEHHVVHDGWSLGRLWREIEAAYQALVAGAAPLLPALPAQYQQFVAWQRSRMAGGYGRAALEFWATYLRGVTEELSLGGGQATGVALDGHGLELELPAALFDATREAARRLAVSEFVVMFSVFAKLLTSESRQRELCIGTAVNARTEAELEPLIGMIVNTIPVRVAVDDGDGLAAIARQVQTSLFKAFRFQDVPLSLIVRRLGIAQKRGRNPVFQTCFSFHDSAMPRLRLGSAEGEIRETQNQSSKFDVNVVVIPPSKARGTSHARMFWQFADGRYPGTDADGLARAYVELLRTMVRGCAEA